MDQFRQIGEVVGSLKALMILKHDIQINQKQCCLLFDMYVQAFDTISEGIKHNLRLNERNTKWKALEYPMRELHRIFKEGEMYIKSCLDVKDWWGKAISLHLNKDCVEFHVHNLLCCFPVVIEAIETVAEISGFDEEDMQKRRTALAKKYEGESMCDPRFFQWMFGKQYLVTREICSELETCLKQDRWYLVEMMREKMNSAENLAINEHKLAEILLKKLDGTEQLKQIRLLPSSILIGSSDYHVKRRLGSRNGHVKEIQWLGEMFALRNFLDELIEPVVSEISLLLSLSHPNILQYHCGFYDDEKKEGYLVMELMNKNLSTYIKEHSNQRKKGPFSVQVAVDIMLQIARGMEYLHSRKIYHGELNPSNVLLKPRNSSSADSYFHVKVEGFGLNTIKSKSNKSANSFIWYAPEVLTENEKPESKYTYKYTEKADVYSYGMICFHLLTGKPPFDEHLQGEKIARIIKTGERPLFPYPSPKYLANLTRKCWQTDPNLRPSFSSLCRILHYIKKVLIINPEHGQPECPPPLVDYCEIEAGYSKKFPGEDSTGLAPVSQIPFQMFAYRIVENEKISGNSKEKQWDSSHYGFSSHRTASIQSDDEHMAAIDDLFFAPSDRRSVCSEIIERRESRFWDQRSAISDTPLRKAFSFDQMSVGSESPREKFPAGNEKTVYGDFPEWKAILTPSGDQYSPRFDTPGKTISSMRKNQKQKKHLEIQENPTSTKTDDRKPSSSVEAEQKTASPVISEEKNSSDDQILITRSEIQEEKHAPDEKKLTSSATEEEKNSSDNQKLKDSESPEKKQSSTTANVKSIRGDSTRRKPLPRRIKPKNPEKKVLSSHEANHNNSISSENPEITASKPNNSKVSSVKKTPFHKKLQDKESSSTTPERLIDPSPRSSPARFKRIQASTMYSPTQTLKASPFPRSPANNSNGYEHGYLSPIASPLNPCTRCARLNKPRKPHSNNQCVHNS